VRTLAQRSAEATNEISALIDQVNQQVDDVIVGIDNVSDKSQEIDTNTSSIESTANRIVSLSQSMFSVIDHTSGDAFLQTVKMDHIVWKLEIYKRLMGFSTKTSDDFTHHTGCRLGKWYYEGEGAKNYNKNSAFIALEHPHAEIHTLGLSALSWMEKGDTDKVLAMLVGMEAASTQVVNLLSEISESASIHVVKLDESELQIAAS
jgi:hypothetical protein